MTEADFKAVLRAELAPLLVKLDSLSFITKSLTALQQDMRMLRAAYNDSARTEVTVGEVEALHDDVNRVQADHAELETRITTLERLIPHE